MMHKIMIKCMYTKIINRIRSPYHLSVQCYVCENIKKFENSSALKTSVMVNDNEAL